MLIFNTAHDLNFWSHQKKLQGKTIGFVPTMGALHEGHVSLVRLAKAQNDEVISSIFVNPTQFNDKNDFNAYPISIEKDKDLLFQSDCSVAYIPSVKDVYPENDDYNLDINIGNIGKLWEGEKRPGHFNGVMQVVKRLLEIVMPNRLYLGKKDYQQYCILSKMVTHYNMPVEVVECPIIREDDGLAMSSRNRRLTVEERVAALQLSNALFAIKSNWEKTTPEQICNKWSEKLNAHDLIAVEYLATINAENLEQIANWTDAKNVIACVAAQVGKVRLIDNVTIY